MKQILLILAVFSLLSFTNCRTPDKISGYYNYETECLGKQLDGVQLVKAWGQGFNRKEARANAYKNALKEILFDGLRNGNSECDVKPLVVEVNAQERHESYFNDFFSKNGIYKRYVEEYNKTSAGKGEKSNTKEAFSYYLKIDVPKLKKLLLKDQILLGI